MNKIRILSDNLANQIAAGEVVEVGALRRWIPERCPRHRVARKLQLLEEFRMWYLCESVNTSIVILMPTLAYSRRDAIAAQGNPVKFDVHHHIQVFSSDGMGILSH